MKFKLHSLRNETLDIKKTEIKHKKYKEKTNKLNNDCNT